MSDRLERIQDAYLNQPIREFLDNDGNADEYAALVFNGEIFGAGQEVIDEELGILTAEDLADALRMLLAKENQLRALDEHRTGTQFQPLDDTSPTVLVQFKAPESLRGALDETAQARGLSRSEAVREAITSWLESRSE